MGAAAVYDRYTRAFTTHLWERPEVRKRWALRHRQADQVQAVAEDLAWTVAADLDSIIPADALATTLRLALLDEIASGIKPDKSVAEQVHFGIGFKVERMLDWFIQHFPTQAQHMIGEIIGDAESRWGVPRHITAFTIRLALSESSLSPEQLNEFLRLSFPPGSENPDA